MVGQVNERMGGQAPGGMELVPRLGVADPLCLDFVC